MEQWVHNETFEVVSKKDPITCHVASFTHSRIWKDKSYLYANIICILRNAKYLQTVSLQDQIDETHEFSHRLTLSSNILVLTC